MNSSMIRFPDGDVFGSAYGAMESMGLLAKIINRCERRSRQYLRHILLIITGLTVEEKCFAIFWHPLSLNNNYPEGRTTWGISE
jgi:hypothetical protein